MDRRDDTGRLLVDSLVEVDDVERARNTVLVRATVRRRRRRVLAAAGSAAAVAAVLLVLVLWPGPRATGPELVIGQDPDATVPDTPGPSATQEPDQTTWRTLEIGGARFDVPADWRTARVPDDGGFPCPDRLGRHGSSAVYLGPTIFPAPCPAPPPGDQPPPLPAVYALPAHANPDLAEEMRRTGTPIQVGRWPAYRSSVYSQPAFLIDEVDLILVASTDSGPVAQILDSVRPGPAHPTAQLGVTLYHCGVDPVSFDGQRWRADPVPFDATNAPERFTGHGWIRRVDADTAIWADAVGGITIRFAPLEPDYQPPPCA